VFVEATSGARPGSAGAAAATKACREDTASAAARRTVSTYTAIVVPSSAVTEMDTLRVDGRKGIPPDTRPCTRGVPGTYVVAPAAATKERALMTLELLAMIATESKR